MEINEFINLLKDKINNLSYEMVEAKFQREKGDNYLHIIVDRVEPINMDDIVLLTNNLNEYIDNELDIEELPPFIMDICSLGAEKPIKIENIDNYIGRFIHVHLQNPISGENIYEGDLIETNEEEITITYKIKTRIKTLKIQKSNILKIRLAIKF
ncbi:MAG: ribosome maturation factor RimP [Bacilli bacterium]